jgi:oxalate decarboxylase/phosphoglucose isomerase-like protein (cupin superfamily)
MDEWFSVVEGRAMLELFDPSRGARREIALDAHEPVAVRVPAGIAHCLVNAGEGPMLALAWSTAEHDPADVEALSTRAETPSPPGTLPRPA